MANVILTPGNDRYVQLLAEYLATWFEVIAGEGDDDIIVFGHQVQPGPGNDRIERVPLPDGTWVGMTVAYWGSSGGVRVDLVRGTAEDGWGGRDTLINVDQVGGSDRNDWFLGNERDNIFYPAAGNDTIDGGAGTDFVRLNWGYWPADGSAYREPLFSDVTIRVSTDGMQATITLPGRQGSAAQYTLSNVEYLQGRQVAGGPEVNLVLADLITHQTMAEDAIAAGGSLRWNATAPLGTPTAVTFSFVTAAPTSGPGAPGFRAFSAAEQQLVREIFAKTSAAAGLTFTEVADSSPGQIRFGVSQQAATKGISWLPGQAGVGDLAGDVWMDVESMLGIAPGTEGYQALLHEIGHALGLRHPRNVDPGENWAMQLREQDDRAALSVMSQQATLSGVFLTDWGLLDVLALRDLYGSRNVAGGNDVHRLTDDHARVQTTLVDDGGVDTIDASALGAGVRLSLKPGSLSDVGLNLQGRLIVENFAISEGSVIEHAIGTPFDDLILGNDADNRLSGVGGNDWIDGGGGLDTAVLPGARGAYVLSQSFGNTFLDAVDGRSGSTTLADIERLRYSDSALALDLDGNAGTVAKILGAVFGPAAVANEVYAGIGLHYIDGGMTYESLMQLAIDARLGAGASHEAVVDLLYKNVVGVPPGDADRGYFVGLLDSGAYTVAGLGVMAADIELNVANINLVGLTQQGLEYVSYDGG